MNPGEVAKISSWDPSSTAELVEAVRAAKRVIAVGAQTKPRLSSVGSDVARISTAKLRGISEYEPSEFTFTAWAGTPVKEIATVLAERGQYLPFDPPLAETGATLAGTVAASRLTTTGDFVLLLACHHQMPAPAITAPKTAITIFIRIMDAPSHSC